jgi:hypothetical protein
MGDKTMNRMELFNEYCLLNIFIFTFLFSDFIEDANLRYSLGWVFLGIAALNLFVNFGIVLVGVFFAIKEALFKLWNRFKLRKARKGL